MNNLRSTIKTVWPAIGLMIVLLFAFAEIAEEVKEGEFQQFDRSVLLAFRDPANLANPIGPTWMKEMMRDFTSLGSFAVLTTIALIVVGFLFLTRKRHSAWVVALSLAGGMVASSSLKWIFARPRPDLVPHIATVYTQSFPSGHAMLSAITYLTIGTLLARTQSDRNVRIFILTAAIILTGIVGISRIYLGVHWPTDVLAGWIVGGCWALLCGTVMVRLQEDRVIEQPSRQLNA